MLHTMTSTRYPRTTIPREELESYVSYLCQKFPKCFFADARLRRPLKKGIEDDLERERVLDVEKRTHAVRFYTRNWTYQGMLQAGVERVDLNGHKAGTVTPLEQLNAQKQVQQEKQQRAMALNFSPITVMSKLHANGQISTDQLSKVTIPPQKPAPTFGRLQKLVETLNTTAADTSDKELKQALVTATLQILITEAQQLIKRGGPCVNHDQ